MSKITSLVVFCLIGTVGCFGQTRKALGDDYIKRQRAIIAKHAKVLMDDGRMPVDFADAFTVLGQYGWHSASGGFFGAYTFHEPAFQQAKRGWWIHGMMRKGSDLLVAVNRNAAFYDFLAEINGTEPKQKGSLVGYRVGYMHKGPAGATVVEVVDWRTLRLDKVATEDVLQYDLSILPPGYAVERALRPSTKMSILVLSGGSPT